MLKFIFLVFLCGCTTTYKPKPSDTTFDESKRDWISVYKEELRIAVENQDREAQYFFIQEIFKMQLKLNHNIEVPANPNIKIID